MTGEEDQTGVESDVAVVILTASLYLMMSLFILFVSSSLLPFIEPYPLSANAQVWFCSVNKGTFSWENCVL